MNKTKIREYLNNYYYGGLRTKILRRDGYKCTQCGMTNKQHRIKWKRSLTIHHIDGNGINRKSKDKHNTINNLITLCCSCHGKIDRRKVKKNNKVLTQEQVIDIKTKNRNGEMSGCALARFYKVGRTTIYDIMTERTWKWVSM